jgi:hypothetical protein
MPLTISARQIFMEAPELECAGIDTDVVAKAIADASMEIGTGMLTQSHADRLGVLLCAHQLTLWLQRKKGVGGASQASGPVTSISAGGVSKSFANALQGATMNEQALGSTQYGREFVRLRRLWTPRSAVS